MTGPTDPALRALPRYDLTYDRNMMQIIGLVDDGRFILRDAALAAAEAAPLDVERLARAMRETMPEWFEHPPTWAFNEWVAAIYAALRSPDTETAGWKWDDGKWPKTDTETAGEAG